MNGNLLSAALMQLKQSAEKRLTRVGGGGVVERPELASERIAVLPGLSSLQPSNEEAPPQALSLPANRFAWSVPPFSHTVLITTLEPSANRQTDVSPILWWIACVRAHLSARDRADLHALILIDQNNQNAQHWSSLLESDDRFCRKLAWLVPSPADELVSSADRFLDRTFLAQPWADEDDVGARGLDPLADLAESLTQDLELSEPVLREWLSVLGATTSSGRELAEELLRIAKDGGDV